MTASLPPLYRYADVLLDGTLAEFLAECREAGDSFETMSKKLWAATEQRVDVSGVTVQAWFERLELDRAAS